MLFPTYKHSVYQHCIFSFVVAAVVVLLLILTVKVVHLKTDDEWFIFQNLSPRFPPIIWETKTNCNLQLVKFVSKLDWCWLRAYMSHLLVHCVLSVCCNISLSLPAFVLVLVL